MRSRKLETMFYVSGHMLVWRWGSPNGSPAIVLFGGVVAGLLLSGHDR